MLLVWLNSLVTLEMERYVTFERLKEVYMCLEIVCSLTLLSPLLSFFIPQLDFGWDKLDEETKMKKRAIELNNGRAAQMGILGIMVHENLGNLNEIGLIAP